ncbi:hypothetical protein KKP3000_002089 [Alicyclobacillus fastidiosus]|uniref:Uncharacterized protein n=1 Tax=Alicyclobacillus fastidiosus TaxID=392011 RepID=A0ABV5AAH9_9BACL|nr:hypothetical protein [Alicyclobacillus fastidiosus]WEH07756.1 hypothetical protein PYS47_13355 [Alicyclobacillus fastidiosus]
MVMIKQKRVGSQLQYGKLLKRFPSRIHLKHLLAQSERWPQKHMLVEERAKLAHSRISIHDFRRDMEMCIQEYFIAIQLVYFFLRAPIALWVWMHYIAGVECIRTDDCGQVIDSGEMIQGFSFRSMGHAMYYVCTHRSPLSDCLRIILN